MSYEETEARCNNTVLITLGNTQQWTVSTHYNSHDFEKANNIQRYFNHFSKQAGKLVGFFYKKNQQLA
jgi:hypothetical protein